MSCVIIPYTARHADTLAGAPDDAEWHYVGDSPTDYWALLAEVWSRGETFMVLEHDVVCRPDVLAGFAACSEPWCVFPYDNHTSADAEAWRNMLGCTRFRAELVRAVPDAVSSIPVQHRDWHNLCDGVGGNLRLAGYWHHWHLPPVVHHRMALSHLASSIGG